MSKSVWLIVAMGAITVLVLSAFMMVGLGSFQETPAAEWVRLAENIGHEFKAEPVSVRVNMRSSPSAMIVNYASLVDTKYNVTLQNTEMEKVANFAITNYKKGREQRMINEIQVTRTETHGSGCFKQTFVAHFTLQNPYQNSLPPGVPGGPIIPRQK